MEGRGQWKISSSNQGLPLNLELSDWIDYLVNEPQVSPVSVSQHWGHKYAPPHLELYLVAGHLNSGSRANVVRNPVLDIKMYLILVTQTEMYLCGW